MKKVFLLIALSPLSLFAQKKQMTITLSDTAVYQLYNLLTTGQKYLAQDFGNRMLVGDYTEHMKLSQRLIDSIISEDKKWHPVPDSLKNKK
jgi:hypothetical protein